MTGAPAPVVMVPSASNVLFGMPSYAPVNVYTTPTSVPPQSLVPPSSLPDSQSQIELVITIIIYFIYLLMYQNNVH